MVLNTRRRMLGLLAAAIGAPRLVPLVPHALAADKPAKTPECFALQPFGDWKGVATNTQAGARIGQISFADADACDLRGEISVADSYDAMISDRPYRGGLKIEQLEEILRDGSGTQWDPRIVAAYFSIRDEVQSIGTNAVAGGGGPLTGSAFAELERLAEERDPLRTIDGIRGALGRL